MVTSKLPKPELVASLDGFLKVCRELLASPWLPGASLRLPPLCNAVGLLGTSALFKLAVTLIYIIYKRAK